MKIATIDDFEEVKAMASKFSDSVYFAEMVQQDRLDAVITALLTNERTQSVVILESGVGMLVAMATQFPFGTARIATEVAWWVEPEHRKSGVGSELLEAFEYWAKNVAGCVAATMISLDDKVGSFLEKNNYVLRERSYLKQFNSDEDEIQV